MTRFIDRKTNWSKIVTVALTGASLAAPAFMTAVAQADSFDSDGGYYQVKKDNGVRRDRNNDGFDDRDTNRDGDVDQQDTYNQDTYNSDSSYNDVSADTTTRTGVVTQDLNGDRFEIRADNGETFIVNLRGQGTVSIREGSRVRVTGLRNGNRITHATVQVLNTGNGYNNGNGYGNGYNNGSGLMRTVQGRVTRSLNGRRFEIASQGATYFVTIRRADLVDLNVGDRVEVFGALTSGNAIQADRVRIISSNGGNSNGGNYGNGGYNNGNSVNVDFSGRVIDVQSQRRLTVRGDNGTTYQVRSDSSFDNNISAGDRVRITGTSRSNGNGNRIINATRVQLRNGNNNNGGYNNDNNNDNQTVSYTGTVRSTGSFMGDGRRIVVLETDNGRTVRFSTDNTWLQPGAHIRIRGGVQGNLVVTPQIDPA